MLTSKRIRAGLYMVSNGHGNWTVEDVSWMPYVSHNHWRVMDLEKFHDGWVGDYHTKAEALQAISQL